MSSSVAPPPVVPHSILYSDSVSLTATTFVSGISWGIMTSFYSVCMYCLISCLRSANATRKTTLLATWITVLWILSSLYTLGNAIAIIYSYSWQMLYPGGPEAYMLSAWNTFLPVMTITSFILAIWFADAMMLWRVVIFHHGIHRQTRGLILSFVFLIYIGMVASGSLILGLISFNQTMYSKHAQKVTIPFLALSVTLNIFITVFISTRLLVYKRKMEKASGRKETQTSPYTSITAMLIESAALYAIWSLVFIVVYAMNNPGQFVMLVTLSHVQVISPVMIVYRVSKGLGWETTTGANLTTYSRMAFAEPQTSQGESESVLMAQDTREEQQKVSVAFASLAESDPIDSA